MNPGDKAARLLCYLIMGAASVGAAIDSIYWLLWAGLICWPFWPRDGPENPP